MTYKEKQVWVTMLSGIIILGLYLKKAISTFMLKGEVVYDDTAFWAKTMLLYIGVGIVLVILMLIVFNILGVVSAEVINKIRRTQGVNVEGSVDFDDVEDEMDRLISLKAGQISYMVVGIGFVLGLVILALNGAPGVMMNITYMSFLLGGVLEGVIKLYYYKRGVSHG